MVNQAECVDMTKSENVPTLITYSRINFGRKWNNWTRRQRSISRLCVYYLCVLLKAHLSCVKTIKYTAGNSSKLGINNPSSFSLFWARLLLRCDKIELSYWITSYGKVYSLTRGLAPSFTRDWENWRKYVELIETIEKKISKCNIKIFINRVKFRQMSSLQLKWPLQPKSFF